MTYYELLGVSQTASDNEVRAAYRRMARATHPDMHGDAAAHRMAQVNEAWRVLRDPAQRRHYDDTLRPASAPRVTPSVPQPVVRQVVVVPPSGPARFPWRLMAGMAALGSVVVLVGAITSTPAKPQPPDNLLQPGSCVVVQTNGDVTETTCQTHHDAVVRLIVGFDERCPSDTEAHRDRQGLGMACVVPI